jgi:hypothetical protein
MDGTSACSECFHDLRIFIDARHAIADGCKHGSAYEPNVPGTNDSQPLHQELSNLPQIRRPDFKRTGRGHLLLGLLVSAAADQQ